MNAHMWIMVASQVLPVPAGLAQAPPTRIDPGAEKIWVDARVDRKPVVLAFDTCSERSVVFRDKCDALGLKVIQPAKREKHPEGTVEIDRTEGHVVDIGDWRYPNATLGVIDMPTLNRPFDGLLGWDILRSSVFAFDWDAGCVRFCSVLPDLGDGFRYWPLRSGANVLTVELPTYGIVLDTGSPEGFALAPPAWERWFRDARNPQTTVAGGYSPGYGFHVETVTWAESIRIDKLEVRGFPVTSFGHPLLSECHVDAMMGLFGMSRFDIVCDGPGRKLYYRLRAKFGWPWQYNRLGAAFVPANATSPELIARVAPGSPAAQAGVENGDQLLGIDNLDVTRWRTDPDVLPLSRFWRGPPGTQLRLRLLRKGEERDLQVTLREIFPEAAGASRK